LPCLKIFIGQMPIMSLKATFNECRYRWLCFRELNLRDRARTESGG
jgi:hypothetical protein